MVSDCRKQTGPPDAGNNLPKSRFIVCHVTKYSTIRGVFQQPWPGVSPTAYFERHNPGQDGEVFKMAATAKRGRRTGYEMLR